MNNGNCTSHHDEKLISTHIFKKKGSELVLVRCAVSGISVQLKRVSSVTNLFYLGEHLKLNIFSYILLDIHKVNSLILFFLG